MHKRFCSYYRDQLHNYINTKYWLKVNTKGGSKVLFLGQGGACYSVPNGPNDLKFCIHGAFVGYYSV